jgi:hypothetical protein
MEQCTEVLSSYKFTFIHVYPHRFISSLLIDTECVGVYLLERSKPSSEDSVRSIHDHRRRKMQSNGTLEIPPELIMQDNDQEEESKKS